MGPETCGQEGFSSRFEILGELGRGGISVVYRARDVLLDRMVAVKVLDRSLSQNEDSLRRFRVEARACSVLTHASIVQVLSFGVTPEGQPYLIMELLEGRTLEQELREAGVLSAGKFEEIFLPVMDALIYAHEKNIVHRDLKPGNIMISRIANEATQVKVLDFGIAKILEGEGAAEAQATVGLVGSPFYMSPEQCAGGKIDQRSDIYSLACLMYESIAGKPPFCGDTPLETMYQHMKMSPPEPVEISGSLEIPRALFEVILCGLAKDPECRPANLTEFRAAVLKALAGAQKLARAPRLAFGFSGKTASLVLLAVFLVGLPVMIAFQMRLRPKEIVIEKKDRGSSTDLDSIYSLQEAARLRNAGDCAAALPKAREALKLATELKAEHADWLCGAHTELARIYNCLKDQNQSGKEYLSAINVFEPGSRDRFTVVGEYCRWLITNGKKKQALEFFDRDMNDAEKSISGGPSCVLAHGYAIYGQILYDQGIYREASSCFKTALWHFDQLTDRRNEPEAVTATFGYYLCCKQLGDRKTGLSELRKTSGQLQKASSPDINALCSFAQLALENELKKEALPIYKLCLKYSSTLRPERARQVRQEANAALAESKSVSGK
jgi:tRNA A-37 threonylcarbamoyl transferase component Bud32/tetratricopeptide (TPR) repeat protein